MYLIDYIFESCGVCHDKSPFFVELIPALGTNDFGAFTVDNGDVVAEKMAERNVVMTR